MTTQQEQYAPSQDEHSITNQYLAVAYRLIHPYLASQDKHIVRNTQTDMQTYVLSKECVIEADVIMKTTQFTKRGVR